MAEAITLEQITGRDECALVESDGVMLHADIVDDWRALKSAAAQAGFGLAIASAYRSYDRQRLIWNEKASGRRPVLDAGEQPLDVAGLSEEQLLYAILRWSALPGASRHHWGTDLDIYDCAAVEEGYPVQLCVSETVGDGPFAPLHDWLDRYFSSAPSGAFFRPYTRAHRVNEPGVGVEPWHISHRAVSRRFEDQLDPARLYAFYREQNDLALQDVLLRHFDEIYQHYVQV